MTINILMPFFQHFKILTLLLLLSAFILNISARPHTPDLSAIKAFGEGPSMMMMNYDGRERTHEEMQEGNRRMKPSYRMPVKMGNIVDGKLVPFA